MFSPFVACVEECYRPPYWNSSTEALLVKHFVRFVRLSLPGFTIAKRKLVWIAYPRLARLQEDSVGRTLQIFAFLR